MDGLVGVVAFSQTGSYKSHANTSLGVRFNLSIQQEGILTGSFINSSIHMKSVSFQSSKRVTCREGQLLTTTFPSHPSVSLHNAFLYGPAGLPLTSRSRLQHPASVHNLPRPWEMSRTKD